jgi:hypothetical protein
MPQQWSGMIGPCLQRKSIKKSITGSRSVGVLLCRIQEMFITTFLFDRMPLLFMGSFFYIAICYSV